MAIRRTYGPSAALAGQLALETGQGGFRQTLDDRRLQAEQFRQQERELTGRQQLGWASLYAEQANQQQRAMLAQQELGANLFDRERSRQYGVLQQRMRGAQESALNRQRFGQSMQLQEMQDQTRLELQDLSGQQRMDQLAEAARLQNDELFTRSGLGLIAQMREGADWSDEDRQRMQSIAQQLQATRKQVQDGQLSPDKYGEVERRFMDELSTMIPTQKRTPQNEWQDRVFTDPKTGMLGVMQPDGSLDVRPFKSPEMEQAMEEQKRLTEEIKAQSEFVKSITDTAKRIMERSIDPMNVDEQGNVKPGISPQEAFRQAFQLHQMSASVLQQFKGGQQHPLMMQGASLPSMGGDGASVGAQSGGTPLQRELGTLQQGFLQQLQQNPTPQVAAAIDDISLMQAIMTDYPDISQAPQDVRADWAKAMARLGLVEGQGAPAQQPFNSAPPSPSVLGNTIGRGAAGMVSGFRSGEPTSFQQEATGRLRRFMGQ